MQYTSNPDNVHWKIIYLFSVCFSRNQRGVLKKKSVHQRFFYSFPLHLLDKTRLEKAISFASGSYPSGDREIETGNYATPPQTFGISTRMGSGIRCGWYLFGLW